MMSRLFIWLMEHSERTYAWGVEKQGVFENMPNASLTEIADYLNADTNEFFEVVVLLPGDIVFSNVITVPDQHAKYLQQSLPYLVEEQLAEDIADMYFVLGPKVSRNEYVVMGITRSKLEQYLAYLGDVGIKPHVMLADDSCCPDSTIITTKEKTLLKLTPHQSYSVDSDSTVDFIKHYLAPQEQTSISWVMEISMSSLALPWMQSLENHFTFHKMTVDAVLPLLADQYNKVVHHYKAINFLQGKYARKLVKKTPRRGWHQIALVAGAVLILHLLFDISQGVYLSIKTHQLEKQSKAFYQELFPNDKATDNVKAQMTGKLKSANAGGAKNSFLDTYSRIVIVINAQHLETSLEIMQVSFNDEKGEIHLDLLAKNFEQLTKLKELLIKDSLQAEIGSATTEAGKTKASLKIWQ